MFSLIILNFQVIWIKTTKIFFNIWNVSMSRKWVFPCENMFVGRNLEKKTTNVFLSSTTISNPVIELNSLVNVEKRTKNSNWSFHFRHLTQIRISKMTWSSKNLASLSPVKQRANQQQCDGKMFVKKKKKHHCLCYRSSILGEQKWSIVKSRWKEERRWDAKTISRYGK